jgi:hypothetical protein
MIGRFPGLQTRLAIVSSVDHSTGQAHTRWLDDDEEGPIIPIPHPFSGRGEGIYIGLRPGTLVALNKASNARFIPVAIIPMRGFYSSDLSDISEMHFDDINQPSITDGEIVIQGMTGGQLKFDETGDVGLRNSLWEGLFLGGDQDEAHRCSILRMPPVAYVISQAGLEAQGIVRRDIRPNEESLDAATYDQMFDLDAEHLFEEVGRDPTQDVTHGTRKMSASGQSATVAAFRNPPFVEKRGILYEFGTGWNVLTRQKEEDRLQDGVLPVRVPSERRERRSNVLSLSLLYPNELMETVDGTLVDIFGNLLDINRSIISPPSGKDVKTLLENMLENARHTIALHREINTRKGWAYTNTSIPDLIEIPDPAQSADNARDRSRWFVDVDKEGLTKLNVPATSETGNVPCLVRYENSSTVDVDKNGNAETSGRSENDAKKLFRSDLLAGQQRQDVFLDQFGPGGIIVKRVASQGEQSTELSLDNRLSGKSTSYVDGKKVSLPARVQAGTAFHSITTTAAKLLETSMNKASYEVVDKDAPIPEEDGAAVSDNVIQSFLDSASTAVQRDKAGRPINYPNAGGRSLHVNLDGNVELSVGANTVDRLSWILDTAGGIVARIGRDRYGRSAVLQMDGSLALEVGGYDFVGSSSDVDRRFANRSVDLPKDPAIFRAGKVVIHVRRANATGTGPDIGAKNKDQVLIIDENGVSIQATGQLSLTSTMDMVLQSDSQIILDAKAIVLYKEDQKRIVLKQGARRLV